ncbi:MAG: DUF885 domain-containing protein [Lachnospiraceae bacterium]|nr:DUF885 domain-containing protein [Lachnospiraceae bacterium]
MKSKRKKLLWAGTLLLFTLFCSLFLLHYLQKSNVQKTNEEFSKFTHELFVNKISANTLTLHYTLSDPAANGIEDAPVTFGPYLPESAGNSAAALENALETLSSFSRQELSEANGLTYDILNLQIQNELALTPYTLYGEYFSPTLGTQAQLPILLAEYTFRTEEDIQDYLALLSQLDTYYESLMQFEQEKSQAGLFMSDETADAIILQCQDFIAHPAQNLLLSTFEERLEALDFLSEEEKKAYVDSNRAAVFGHVFPAYEQLIDGLSKLKGTGTNPYGLSYYEQGKDYYTALVACTVGTGRTMEEVKALINEQMDTDLHTIAKIIGNHPELLQTASRSIEQMEPQFILETLEQKIQKDFPSVEHVSYEVKYVDPSLEAYLSPAFYLTPPMDRMNEHTIYINPAGNYDSLSLFTTLAHEGYPGHLYQTIYENSCDLDPVRNLFYFGGYIEGWATYVERYSYFYTTLDPDMAALLSANSGISLGLYAKLDVGIHYDGWTPEDASDFLANYGINNDNTVHSIYQAIVQNPGNYLKYYLGAAEIQKLKEQANAALSDEFVLKDFHEFLLSVGPAPFPVLESYLKDWLAS